MQNRPPLFKKSDFERIKSKIQVNKRICFIQPHFKTMGGLEKQTLKIAETFEEKGYDTTILSMSQNLSSKKHIHKYLLCPKWPEFLQMISFDKKCTSWIFQNKPQIVFGSGRNSKLTHIRAGNGLHISFLKKRALFEVKRKKLFRRINPKHLMILKMERASFENSNLKKIYTNSQMIKNEILQSYDVPPQKIEVIYNGVEWKEMEVDYSEWEEKRTKILKHLQLEKDVFHFLFIGNDYFRKGLKELLLGFSQLQTQEVHLSIVGKENHLSYFQELAQKLKVEKKVSFFGPQKNIRIFYQMADVLIIPSHYDPFANVTLEAASMGLFVVSSTSNGGSEILSSINGSTIENLFNPDSVKTSLLTALNHKKTKKSAEKIRDSIKKWDFSSQINKMIDSIVATL